MLIAKFNSSQKTLKKAIEILNKDFSHNQDIVLISGAVIGDNNIVMCFIGVMSSMGEDSLSSVSVYKDFKKLHGKN